MVDWKKSNGTQSRIKPSPKITAIRTSPPLDIFGRIMQPIRHAAENHRMEVTMEYGVIIINYSL